MSISYTAIVLDEASQIRLRGFLAGLSLDLPDIECHHSTICLGPAGESVKPFIGTRCQITVTGFAANDKVAAVSVVTPFPSTNPVKHITLAINKSIGGKPMMSNKLSDWKDVLHFLLSGTVEEIPNK